MSKEIPMVWTPDGEPDWAAYSHARSEAEYERMNEELHWPNKKVERLIIEGDLNGALDVADEALAQPHPFGKVETLELLSQLAEHNPAIVEVLAVRATTDDDEWVQSRAHDVLESLKHGIPLGVVKVRNIAAILEEHDEEGRSIEEMLDDHDAEA